jgi:hypothetical protein
VKLALQTAALSSQTVVIAISDDIIIGKKTADTLVASTSSLMIDALNTASVPINAGSKQRPERLQKLMVHVCLTDVWRRQARPEFRHSTPHSQTLREVSSLHASTSLRNLDHSCSSVEDVRGLELICGVPA